LEQVAELAAEQRYDYLLIESTGIGEPMPVAATFAHIDEESKSLSQVARLDTMVTVVDAASFFAHMESADDLRKLGIAADASDDRTIVDLLIDQVEFANILVLNKTDLLSAEQLRVVEAMIRKLNPDARCIHATFGKISPREILNTKLFDFDRAAQSPGWLKELLGSGAGLVKDFYNSSSGSSNTTDYGGGGGDYNNSILNPMTDSSGLPTGTGTENMNSSI
jgi:G3E family GTPase